MVDTVSLITRTSIIRKKACAVHLILYEIKNQLSRQPNHILVSPLIIEAKGLSSHLENSDRSVFKRLQAYFGTRWLTSYDNRPTGYSRGSLPDSLPLKAFLTYCFFPFLFLFMRFHKEPLKFMLYLTDCSGLTVPKNPA